MTSIPLKFVALDIPEPNHPVLKIQTMDSETIFQFEVTRDHLLLLNNQTADILLTRKLHE
jgi:hypothetical protein